MNSKAVRIDIWLWRARFAKTRGLAAALVERGAVRLTQQGRQTRLHKTSRVVHPGNEITLARDGRVTVVRVEARASGADLRLEGEEDGTPFCQ